MVIDGTLQIAQAGRVNADTRASLAEIRATSDALLSNQQGQFSYVLRAALKTAVPAAVEDITSPPDDGNEERPDVEEAAKELEERILVRVNEVLNAARHTTPATDAPARRTLSPIAKTLSNYPDEKRGRELLEILGSLSPKAAAYLGRNAAVIRERARSGLPADMTVTGTAGKAHQELMNRGPIAVSEISPDTKTGKPKYRLELTDLGAEVGSLLTGMGGPTWLSEST